MGKIIIITFAFLGFAFYEMSDGDEFVPIAQEKRAALEVERADEARMIAEAKAEKLKAVPAPTPKVILASAVATPVTPVAKTDDVIAADNLSDGAEKIVKAVKG